MSYYLSELVPTSGLLVDYPLADVTAAGLIATVTDYSGNSRTLSATAAAPDRPAYELDSLNGHPSIEFAGEAPLLYNSTFGLPKHIFMVAKYDLAANFGGTYRGLLSDTGSVTVLVGDNAASSTKFTNLAIGGDFSYKKSQTSHAESAQEAPFTNFELLELSFSTGFSLTTLQLGQQLGLTGRRWYGRIPDLKMYSAVLTGADLRKLRLYYDLKFHLFALNSTTLYFPDPTTTGIKWARYKKIAKDWTAVTVDHTYDDEGKSFNTSTNTPPTFWEIGFTGMTSAQIDIFDAFNDAARRDRTFSLIDKAGVTQTGVRIVNYERDHDAHKSWSHNCQFTLAKFP